MPHSRESLKLQVILTEKCVCAYKDFTDDLQKACPVPPLA